MIRALQLGDVDRVVYVVGAYGDFEDCANCAHWRTKNGARLAGPPTIIPTDWIPVCSSCWDKSQPDQIEGWAALREEPYRG